MTKIAVVEDELTMREIMVEKLKSSGFDVVEAEDGLKAVKLIEKETPDLVLLDLMLPDLDGYGVLTKIRTNKTPAIAKMPVIILTNLWSKDEIVKTKKLGVSAYIIKAYMTTEEIVDKVKEILGK
jgi:DNA-binding response OmpR family regulator